MLLNAKRYHFWCFTLCKTKSLQIPVRNHQAVLTSWKQNMQTKSLEMRLPKGITWPVKQWLSTVFLLRWLYPKIGGENKLTMELQSSFQQPISRWPRSRQPISKESSKLWPIRQQQLSANQRLTNGVTSEHLWQVREAVTALLESGCGAWSRQLAAHSGAVCRNSNLWPKHGSIGNSRGQNKKTRHAELGRTWNSTHTIQV